MRARLLVAALAGMALLTVSCGKATELATEKMIEKSSGADNVDITKDGVKVETKDGSFEAGATSKYPDDLPDAPKFADSKLTTASKTKAAEGTTWLLAGTVKDAEKAFQKMVSDLEGAGWEIELENETSSPDYTGMGSATKGDLSVTFGTADGDEPSFYFWLTKTAK